jgi:DNA invertase Pin-like site-specific DNA recombinase
VFGNRCFHIAERTSFLHINFRHINGASTMTKTVALYLRVSTDDQSLNNQRRDLIAAAERHGWTMVAEFSDNGISGSKGRDQRPGFNKLMEAIARKEFDMVAAWSVDRLSRSLHQLVAFLGEIHGKGVDLYLHTNGIDTSTLAGKAMFQMLGVFAELERGIIVERIKAGVARARAQGKHMGRPRIDAKLESRIRERLRAGDGMLKIAKEVGVGSGTVQRIAKDMPGPFVAVAYGSIANAVAILQARLCRPSPTHEPIKARRQL